ncbi:hypothetical protein [Vulcanisaeta distributa]|uniref:hypothetical protein n=1 Tax=Vulcanisaeta distributa TaxID=164451 RepID=UPI001FB25DB0|nr:hypothetical protein [Vulcanisaeta distributa]
MSMFPEAVPIIGQEVSRVPNLVFTNKLAMELRGEVGPAIIKRLRMLSKEAIGIVRINGRIHARLPNSLSKFDKAIVILGPGGVGESWLRYIMSLSNTVIGFTFDSLMRIMNARPHLLNIPNELFIDPVINGETPVLPRAIPKVAIDWLMDYVDSGGVTSTCWYVVTP